MFKKILKVLMAVFGLGVLTSSVFAIKVDLPSDTGVKGAESTVESGDQETYVFAGVIRGLNSFIRYFIGITATAVISYGGRLLIQARGDESKMSQGNHLVAYTMVGVIYALVAYAAVQLLIKLFG